MLANVYRCIESHGEGQRRVAEVDVASGLHTRFEIMSARNEHDLGLNETGRSRLLHSPSEVCACELWVSSLSTPARDAMLDHLSVSHICLFSTSAPRARDDQQT